MAKKQKPAKVDARCYRSTIYSKQNKEIRSLYKLSKLQQLENIRSYTRSGVLEAEEQVGQVEVRLPGETQAVPGHRRRAGPASPARVKKRQTD